MYGFVSNNPINKWDLLGMTEGDTRTFYTVDDEGMWEIVETEVYDGAVGGTVWEETSRTLIQKPKPSNNGTDPNKKEPNNMPADPTYGAGATGGMVCAGTAIPLPPFIATTTPDGPNALGTGGIILLGGAAAYIIGTAIDNTFGISTWISDKFVGPVFPQKVDNAQDKRLSPGEIQKLQDAGIDPHDLKPGAGYDLFKDGNGNIVVKPINGNGPGEPTGININNPGGG